MNQQNARELYKLQTEQLNNANLRVERTKAFLKTIGKWEYAT